MKASDIMTADVITIRPEATIREAIELVLGKGISGLPVTDDSGKLVGVVTEFALLAIAYDPAVCEQTVGEHMTHDLITVAPDAPVSMVADHCIVHRVRRVPVVQGGKLLGLISRRDVLKAVFASQRTLCV